MQNNNDIFQWFSLHWFEPSTLKSFQWDNPLWLYIIPNLPLLFLLRWIIYFRFRQKFDVALDTDEVKTSIFIQIARIIPSSIFILFISMILISLARPQRSNEKIDRHSEGIDIILVLDISESMLLEDFKPNRLEAAKDIAIEFIEGRKNDRIGLVVFSGKAFSLSPLSTDYDMLKEFIRGIKPDMLSSEGTAIGDAIGVGINRMKESDAKSKVMILISDGENSEGNIDPYTASRLAHAFKIKIYTVGIGSDGLHPLGKDSLGQTRYVQSYLDEGTLRQIAEAGKGKYFKATNMNALKEIFLRIDQYEKAPVEELRFRDNKDYYQVYLTWGIALFLLWLFLKNTFVNNFLED